ncbi:MAG: hypothetical protein ABI151_04880 [Chitinophagaceae bacterium]
MGFEPEVQAFLQKVMFSIGAALLWLILNMTIGIFGGWMFFHDQPTVGNYIFYAWFFVSLFLLLRFLFRTWKGKFPHG